jgi:hypothetical protein
MDELGTYFLFFVFLTGSILFQLKGNKKWSVVLTLLSIFFGVASHVNLVINENIQSRNTLGCILRNIKELQKCNSPSLEKIYIQEILDKNDSIELESSEKISFDFVMEKFIEVQKKWLNNISDQQKE